MPFEVLAAVSDSGQLLGGVIFISYRRTDIETLWAGEPGWLTRGNLRSIFTYPFEQLGVRRVTGIIHRKNKQARKIAEKIGFKLEGVCRQAFNNGDAIVYGIIKQECRWI
jgi:RimJ/RimL family protein N-acetyltransferase